LPLNGMATIDDFPNLFPGHTVELLNTDSYLSHPIQSDQFERQLGSQGEFKMSRPARPQYCLLCPVGRAHCWRAEHAVEYMSSTKGRERRWQTFSTLPHWKLV
jgi:hypothetical protein